MNWPQRILWLVVGLALLGAALSLIRKRRLREEYGVLWVGTGLAILILVLMPWILGAAAGWLEVDPAALMALVCFILLAAIVLHYSVVISRHAEREKSLALELALLKDEIERLRTEIRESPPPIPEPRPKPPALRT
jgi:cell division protein FtsW (lipid II flippase)